MESQGSLVSSLMPLIVLFAILYFLIIRPQQKQQKEHNAMLDALAKGDKIITSGGLIVEILKVEEDFYKIKNVDGSEARLIKSFVSSKWEE